MRDWYELLLLRFREEFDRSEEDQPPFDLLSQEPLSFRRETFPLLSVYMLFWRCCVCAVLRSREPPCPERLEVCALFAAERSTFLFPL